MIEQESPTVIVVDHPLIDGWHIFTSDQVRGLYVAHPDRELAYKAVAPTIETLLTENAHVPIK